MITAKLRKPRGKARYFRFLIDSGADYTLISQKDAFLLGINYKKIRRKEIKVELANSSSVSAKKIELLLSIENLEFKIPVLIFKKEVDSLLGRKGVFDLFDITFKEREGFIVFKRA